MQRRESSSIKETRLYRWENDRLPGIGTTDNAIISPLVLEAEKTVSPAWTWRTVVSHCPQAKPAFCTVKAMKEINTNNLTITLSLRSKEKKGERTKFSYCKKREKFLQDEKRQNNWHVR